MKRITLVSFALLLVAGLVGAQGTFAPNSGVAAAPVDTGYIRVPASITQNTDPATITPLNSVACPVDDDRFLRRFDLDGDHGITDPFDIMSVDFAVESNLGGTGVAVTLYTIPNAAAFVSANLTQIGTATQSPFTAPDLSIANFPVAGTVADPTADDLVVEIFIPDSTQGFTFFPGSNAAGQLGPTFLQSAGCGAPEPTDAASIGFPDMHIVMTVNGDVQSGMADVEITKDGSAAGGNVEFDLWVTNNGPDEAVNCIVTDMLPAEVTYVSDDCGGTNTPPWTWNAGTIANGASAHCTITTTLVDPSTPTVSNTASVICDTQDPVTVNNGSSVDISTQGILEIPTLGHVGLTLLLLVLASLGVVFLRRR